MVMERFACWIIIWRGTLCTEALRESPLEFEFELGEIENIDAFPFVGKMLSLGR